MLHNSQLGTAPKALVGKTKSEVTAHLLAERGLGPSAPATGRRAKFPTLAR